MKKLLFFTFAIMLIFSCKKQKNYVKLAGITQGTSFHISYNAVKDEDLKKQIDSILKKFDSSLSIFNKNSIISRINQNDNLVKTDSYFEIAFEKSVEINNNSEGAFDITVSPLVNFWGFGFKKNPKPVKDTTKVIDSLLKLVGMSKVRIENHTFLKEDSRITLDCNAIAQGLSVDIVSEFLESKGIKDYMVEIGGEVRVRGFNEVNEYWNIGIDKPIENSTEFNRELQTVFKLKNKSAATSGNYRKFKEENGQKFTHTINPKTGFPVKSNLLSATIIATDCLSADAYATACMVLGLEKSLELLKKRKELSGIFIYTNEKGEFLTYISDELKPFILN